MERMMDNWQNLKKKVKIKELNSVMSLDAIKYLNIE